MIEVCCALIRKRSKLIAVQKGPGSSHPMKWEFPGGKKKENETHEECIVREIREELGVDIRIFGRLEPIGHNYPDKQIRLVPFLCGICSREPVLWEHIALRLVEIDAWETVDWVEADRVLIRRNLTALRQIISQSDAEK